MLQFSSTTATRLVAGALILCPFTASAVLSVSLGGNEEAENWNISENPDHFRATWPGDTMANGSGSAGNALWSGGTTIVTGSGTSLYSGPMSGDTLLISNDLSGSSLVEVQSVLIRLDLAPAGPFLGATLSYNGGTQNLNATWSASGTGDFVANGPDGSTPSTAFVYQWDLSGVSEEITSYEISWDVPVHTASYETDLISSDAISPDLTAQAVPEPGLLALAGLGGLSLLRRRRS